MNCDDNDTGDGKTPDAAAGKAGLSARQSARAERLAAELRANLKRRKASQRDREGARTHDAPPAASKMPHDPDA